MMAVSILMLLCVLEWLEHVDHARGCAVDEQ
jgi:hypothetical protein